LGGRKEVDRGGREELGEREEKRCRARAINGHNKKNHSVLEGGERGEAMGVIFYAIGG